MLKLWELSFRNFARFLLHLRENREERDKGLFIFFLIRRESSQEGNLRDEILSATTLSGTAAIRVVNVLAFL